METSRTSFRVVVERRTNHIPGTPAPVPKVRDVPAKTPTAGRAKKTYARPRLVSHGRFTDIVQGQGGVKNEPGGPKSGVRSRV